MSFTHTFRRKKFFRYFSPWNGILEDPVTGSAHTVLGVYYSKILKKNEMYALQLSERSGEMKLILPENSDRILLQGNAVTVMNGNLKI